MARIILISALFAVYLVAGCPEWLADGTVPVWKAALLYQFFHANVFHLAVNCLAIWSMFPPKSRNGSVQLLAGLAVGLAVYPLHIRPIVGISNMIFAVAGMRTPSLRSEWWASPNTIVYLATMAAMLLMPQFSAVTHIVSFTAGVAIAILTRRFKKLLSYAERYMR